MKTQRYFTRITLSTIAIALGLMLTGSVQAATTRINATLEPSRITLDDAAQLAVTVQGSTAVEPNLPRVDGLEFTPVGQNSSFQSINGAVSASVSYVYQVTALKAGTFTIPAIGAARASSKPLQLIVVKDSGHAVSATRSLPPPNVNWPSATASAESANGQPAFLRVVTPKKELFVGELVPVQIKAYFRRGMSASLNGLPSLSSDAFTLSKLTREPQQSQEIVDGTAYRVVTWPATLSPVKAGDYSLNMELPVIVRVQDRSGSRSRNPFGPMFDDSFFDNFFGRVSEKPITLTTDIAAMNVLPLPATGRPASFSGAVGKFDVRSEVTPTTAMVGDPLTLKLVISGTGNFDRVTSPALTDSAEFKTYKPSAQFEPADCAGLEGTKTLEQAVVPKQSGQVEIPAIVFSYFDPEKREYVTRESKAVSVTVAPGSTTPANVTSAPTQPVATASTSPASTPNDGLQPNKVEPGRFVSSLQPVFLRPWFTGVIVAPLVLLGFSLWILKRREHLASDPARAQDTLNTAALRESLKGMESAMKVGATRTFFVYARHALQERLAQLWNMPPHAVTVAEINMRLRDAGADVRSVFQAADQVAYAGGALSPTDLSRWREVVHEQLKRLEAL
jgi:hypothetical protein